MNSTTPYDFVEIDVTSAVRFWKAGILNYGLIIWATNEDIDGYEYWFYNRSYKNIHVHTY